MWIKSHFTIGKYIKAVKSTLLKDDNNSSDYTSSKNWNVIITHFRYMISVNIASPYINLLIIYNYVYIMFYASYV